MLHSKCYHTTNRLWIGNTLPVIREVTALVLPHFADFSVLSAYVPGLKLGELTSLHLTSSSSLKSCNEGDAGTS